jgi:hypothetical protein
MVCAFCIPAGIAYAYLAAHRRDHSWAVALVLLVGLGLAQLGWWLSARLFGRNAKRPTKVTQPGYAGGAAMKQG